MEYKECYQKIYASWLGKLIGIRLGAPIENWLGKDVRKMYHPIRNYTVDYGQFAADDDLPVIRMNLQLFKLADRLRRIHGKGKLYKPRIRSFSQHIS